ncbi:MAG: hypothetical protein ACI9TI_002037, partial [Natronomonas sp.]
MATVKEFGFELRVCAWAERNWPPGPADRTPPIVARQLGTKRRRWDTIVVEPTDSGVKERAPFGESRLGSDLLFVARHAPA